MSSNLIEIVLETVIQASDVRVESSSSNYNLSQIDEIFGTELSGAVDITVLYCARKNSSYCYRRDIQFTYKQ